MFRGRVLIADDDFLLARRVSAALERDGFFTEVVNDGLTALKKLQANGGSAFDCAVLDVSMPGMTGLDVLAELRTNGHCMPVLMLTDLSGELDAVVGFNTGADDYVGKPLRARELVARVRRLVQSSSDAYVPVSIGSAVFNLGSMTVAGPGGSEELSVTEAQLLRPLLTPPGRLVPQAELLASGWGSSDRRNLRSLYEHVRRIRVSLQKVESDVTIRSVRNAGYRLATSS